MAWGDYQRTDGCFTYYCSEDGMKGVVVIDAPNKTAAEAEYQRRTGRKPDIVTKT